MDWLPEWLIPSRGEESKNLAILWDVSTGAEVLQLDDCVEACFSLDGQRLAALMRDGTIEVWDISAPRRNTALTLGLAFGLWLAILGAVSLLSRLRQRFSHQGSAERI